jgi:hypothetical protein
MIKERLCPKDPTDQKLITMLKSKINGRSKRVDKKDEYKLSSAEKVFAFFHAHGEQLNEEDRRLRQKLRQHFQNFFEKGLWRDWLCTYFKGDEGSKVWISNNIREIQAKLFNPEYQPNFKHNDDVDEEGFGEQQFEETYQEHGYCYILVVIDILSGYCVLRGLKSKTEVEVATNLWDILANYGTPAILQSY